MVEGRTNDCSGDSASAGKGEIAHNTMRVSFHDSEHLQLESVISDMKKGLLVTRDYSRPQSTFLKAGKCAALRTHNDPATEAISKEMRELLDAVNKMATSYDYC